MSDLQRMSVVVEELEGEHDIKLFMKGAPETVIKYCMASTGQYVDTSGHRCFST
jgi:magnesium-transporting ATPase (P-type)